MTTTVRLRACATAALCAAVAFGQAPANVRLTVAPGVASVPGANNVPLLVSALGDAAEPAAFDLTGENDLWALRLRPPPAGCGVPTTQIVATPTNCTFASFFFFPAPDAFLAVWNGGRHATMPAGETFTVYVHGSAAPGSNLYELNINVLTATPSLVLAEVDFPRIRVRSRNQVRGFDGTASEVLAVPNAQGAAIMDPLTNLLPEFPYAYLPDGGSLPYLYHPGRMSMQWMAYYAADETNAPVLHFGSRDVAGYSKRFLAGPQDGDGFELGLRHEPVGNTVADNDFFSPYPATLGVVRGDWYDAAQEYRTWVFGRPAGSRPAWLTRADGSYLPPLGLRNAGAPADRPLPATLNDAELLLTYDLQDSSADYATWAADAAAQKAFYGANTVPAIAYHANKGQPFAPSTEGAGEWRIWRSEFSDYLPHTQTLWGPYVNFDLYDSRTGSYSNPMVPHFSGSVDQYRLTAYDGCPIYYDPLTQFLPRLCHARSNGAGRRFCSEFMQAVALDAQTKGARNVYLDEFTYEGGFPCYGAGHLHPQGGGSYMTTARRANVDDMLAAARATDPGFFTSSESPCEAFSDVVPLAFEHASPDLTPAYARSLPMYSAVYRDYQLTSRILGVSSTPIEMSGNALSRRLMALGAYFGDLPSGGARLPAAPFATNLLKFGFAQSAYLLQAVVGAGKHAAVRPFFHTGRRLRDPVHTAPRVPPDLLPSNAGPLSIWNAFIDGSGDQPTVYVSAWADPAHADRFGLMTVNWTDVGDTFAPSATVGGLQTLTVTLDPAKLGVPAGNYAVHKVDLSGDTTIATIPLTGATPFTVAIPPLTAWFVYFVKV